MLLEKVRWFDLLAAHVGRVARAHQQQTGLVGEVARLHPLIELVPSEGLRAVGWLLHHVWRSKSLDRGRLWRWSLRLIQVDVYFGIVILLIWLND